jgi:hypothetical protein
MPNVSGEGSRAVLNHVGSSWYFKEASVRGSRSKFFAPKLGSYRVA